VPSGSYHKHRGRYPGAAGVMMVGTYRKTSEAADAPNPSMFVRISARQLVSI